MRISSNSAFLYPVQSLTHVFFFPFLSFPCSLSAEAYGMLMEVDKKGMLMGPTTYDHLIRSLLSEGSVEDAMSVKDM